jgi:hypothetical protein
MEAIRVVTSAKFADLPDLAKKWPDKSQAKHRLY